MKKTAHLTLLCVILSLHAKPQDPLPNVIFGTIERIQDFPSHYFSSVKIDIWLPEGYPDSANYAVLYMHDGQMLFDPAITWNKQAWNVDDVASEQMKSKKVKPFIVVGIWNRGETRHADYFPQKPFEDLLPNEKDSVYAQLQKYGRAYGPFHPQSDYYLKFIVEELKPYIDSHYSVFTNSKNTFIAGSSMGGLISLYALCEYPMVFGGAACLSTHWPGTFTLQNNPVPHAFLRYLNNKLPSPRHHKIYFDYGDQTLDALYPEIQKQADWIMIQKGYNKTNWRTDYYPGHDHSEKSWNNRLHIPLEFLLGMEETK
ncbi:MAG: alpha/beta hydrolase-fold protein [Bacteroidales bacterium]|jgi:predicted alpha/beta superfamily hydrolase|nr:alpha/beta hydrolase-fold protein [Bacteroidales bacterium]NCC74306.1 alpha/beta hydrolase [Sphingobacteriia bacterium]MDD2323084.1 alpha/beta hydrolase-fold protein [Bacteroidales bacterium]MDD3010244.1 alpha/beta hydrolase-fold protein [Bacteroidales bacterium]MDD3961976.1 alpha/beta hydrolase-fold protein [Bacteroidales bacterium]